MNKKAHTETDIRTRFITPAIVGSDGSQWYVMTQVSDEVYFTKGRVIVRGKAGYLKAIRDLEAELYLKAA